MATFYSPDYEPRCELCRNGEQHTTTHSQMKLVTASRVQLTGRTPDRIISQRVLPPYNTQNPPPFQSQVNRTPERNPVSQLRSNPVNVYVSKAQPYQNPSYSNESILKSQHQYQQQSSSYVTHVHNVEHVPVVHELHHVNRAVSVVSVEEIEGPWRSKVIKLEKQLLELELMVKKNAGRPIVETKQVVVEDQNAIRQLEGEIDHLEKLLRQKEIQIEDLQNQAQQYEEELEAGGAETQSKIEQYDKELAQWKKKFSDLNKVFHTLQEDIMMKQAELESMKKRSVVVTKNVTTTQGPTSSVRRSIHNSDNRGSAYRN